MRSRRALGVLAVAASCRYASRPLDPDAATVETSDGPLGEVDAPAGALDAVEATRLYANYDTTLYAIDLEAMTATLIGSIADGTTPVSIEGLAFHDGALVGLPYASGERVVGIDPSSGAIVSEVPLDQDRVYLGLTSIPAGELGAASPAMLVAGTDGGDVYEIQPVSGTARWIGSLGSGMRVAGDIAWLRGRGLFGTLSGGACDYTCIGTISPTDGHATVLSSNAPYGLWALSGYGDQLRALAGDGTVYAVDPQTGAITFQFYAGAIDFWEAAP